ncbi:MAG: methyl-accepting chemotaxis protein [Solirubrobacteraceae bacterium]
MLDSPATHAPGPVTPRASWDLTVAPPWNGADPADQLADLATAVADMVGGIHRAVLAFSGGGARSAVGTAAVSARVHQIHTELEAVAVAVEALHAGAEDAARAGEESARMCGDLASEVERGSVVLARVVEAVEAMQAQRERIERLADQLEEIGAFSGVIKQVADKTKLLALNATIEAARAGAEGAAFRVVADEIGSLAADTEAQTRRIAAVVTATHADLEPLRNAIDAGRVHGDGVAEAYDARETVRRIGELAEKLTAPAEHVAAAAESQLQALGEMTGHMQGTVLAVAEVDEHATQMSGQALELSSSAEDVYDLVRPFWTDSFVDRATEVARTLARDVSSVFDAVIDSGRISLHAVLDLRYEEITGPRIGSLGRLFDVSRVPPTGFDPPKYSTAYDALVDEELMALYDRSLVANPWLALAVSSDLNVYAPVHARRLSADWTGDPAKDLVGNRVKRILIDNPALARSNRMGIGGRELPPRPLTRTEFRMAGCELVEPPGGDDRRLVQTYARDTGVILTVLTVPIYVRGERWGAAVIGWEPDSVAH